MKAQRASRRFFVKMRRRHRSEGEGLQGRSAGAALAKAKESRQQQVDSRQPVSPATVLEKGHVLARILMRTKT